MYKMEVDISKELDEQTYYTKLKNGLDIYICKKVGFEKKIGLFGTKYGSINKRFLDIKTNKKLEVPDGIAHFLEHKLFEKEGANALDLFAKMGVSSNAYTSFDQTVYYFETVIKFEECIKMLVKLVKEPYFTDENVAKEQGIIGQEIMMYDDDPNFMVYFNMLRAMYKINPVRIDIAGTIESIENINKELLYTCYNTFYSPQNMFFIVVGDVDIEKTIQLIQDSIIKYESNELENKEIEKFFEVEDRDINKKEIEKNMDIYMSQLCIGYKLNVAEKEEEIKREVLAEFISDMYFSKLSDFFILEYQNKIISDEINFDYESSESFSHIIINAESTNIEKLRFDILNYIEDIKFQNIDEEMFNIIKKKKIGNIILSSDNIDNSYRRIIKSNLNNTSIYKDIEILEDISMKDIKDFLNLLDSTYQVSSIIKPKYILK